jgi:plastocyanin
MQAWLGQRTSADINFVAQILILLGLWVGAYFAHVHRIRRHQAIQTTLVIMVIGAADPSTAAAQAGEILALAQRISGHGDQSAARIAQLIGESTAQPAVPEVTVPGGSNTATVIMKDFTFLPRTLRVKQGTTVVFLNQHPARHTVTADDGRFDSRDMDPAQTFHILTVGDAARGRA